MAHTSEEKEIGQKSYKMEISNRAGYTLAGLTVKIGPQDKEKQERMEATILEAPG